MILNYVDLHMFSQILLQGDAGAWCRLIGLYPFTPWSKVLNVCLFEMQPMNFSLKLAENTQFIQLLNSPHCSKM